jgi:hypothetical protein
VSSDRLTQKKSNKAQDKAASSAGTLSSSSCGGYAARRAKKNIARLDRHLP